MGFWDTMVNTARKVNTSITETTNINIGSTIGQLDGTYDKYLDQGATVDQIDQAMLTGTVESGQTADGYDYTEYSATVDGANVTDRTVTVVGEDNEMSYEHTRTAQIDVDDTEVILQEDFTNVRDTSDPDIIHKGEREQIVSIDGKVFDPMVDPEVEEVALQIAPKETYVDGDGELASAGTILGRLVDRARAQEQAEAAYGYDGDFEAGIYDKEDQDTRRSLAFIGAASVVLIGIVYGITRL